MLHVRPAALVVAVALCASTQPARAQSYHAVWAVLEHDDVPVATLSDAPIEVLSWQPDGEPEVRFRDHAITLHAHLALDAPETRVLVGVGRRARLDTGTVWSAWLDAGHWRKLRRGVGSRPEIELEDPSVFGLDPLPFPTAIIAERVPGAPGAPPDPDSDPTPLAGGWRELRDPDHTVVVRAAPDAAAATWEATSLSFYRRRGRVGGWTAYDVWSDGIVVRGYVEYEPALLAGRPLPDLGVIAAYGTPWCRGIATLDGRAVPAGTELRVPGRPSIPFGRTHRPLIARRIDDHVVELRRTGATQWVVRAHLPRPASELDPAIVEWIPNPPTCYRPPPWPD